MLVFSCMCVINIMQNKYESCEMLMCFLCCKWLVSFTCDQKHVCMFKVLWFCIWPWAGNKSKWKPHKLKYEYINNINIWKIKVLTFFFFFLFILQSTKPSFNDDAPKQNPKIHGSTEELPHSHTGARSRTHPEPGHPSFSGTQSNKW